MTQLFYEVLIVSKRAVSRSAGFQNQPHFPDVSTPAATIRNLGQEMDIDASITGENVLLKLRRRGTKQG